MTIPETSVRPLRWGWLDRLASFLCAAYAGEGDEGESGDEGGEEGSEDRSSEDALDDEDTVFGGLDEDEEEEEDPEEEEKPRKKSKDDSEEEELEEEEDDDDSLFGRDEDEEESEESEEEEEEDLEEEELDEDALQEQRERSEVLEELWDTRLERAHAAGDSEAVKMDKVALGGVQLREDGFKRFKAILAEEGDDTDKQAKAIFEVAMDAAIQTVDRFHKDALNPYLEGRRKTSLNAELERRRDEFDKTPEGVAMHASPKVKAKMRDLWEKKIKKVGVDLAMRIPHKDYFRMAGGRVTKKARAEARKAAAKPTKKASKKTSKKKSVSRKKSDLAAARRPRARRASGLTRKRKPRSEERENADYLRDSAEPLFTVM